MPDDESKYNYLHSKTRIKVEMAFGLWKNRFQVFKTALNWKEPKMMSNLITATIILHNWLIDLEDYQEDVDLLPWMLLGAAPQHQQNLSVVDGEQAKVVRDLHKDYLFTL